MDILVETSARHIHVTKEDLQKLFGEGRGLTHKKDLSQPGQFVCEERVDIVGPKNTIKNVVILGPCREATQAEVSLTDARNLGLEVPIRESGDIRGSAGCTIKGSVGEVNIKEGVIVAKRHIHMMPQDAKNLNVNDKDNVNVEISTKDRSLIFKDVVVRVSGSFGLAMHIDTDESNAAGISGQCFGRIVK